MKFNMHSIRKHFLHLSRDKVDTFLLIFTTTLVLAPFAFHNPTWLIATALALISWRVVVTLTGQTLPQKWLLISVAIILVIAIYFHFHTWLGKEAGVALLILLSCLKMLEMHARRDAIAVIFVGYFLLMGQLWYSQSLLAVLYLLLCFSFLVSAQITFQYLQGAPKMRQRIAAGFKLSLLALPLALVLFVLFPRLQGPFWGNQTGNGGAMTGLSDSMEVGNVAELALSDQIAFRVKFDGAIPSQSDLYWRGIVLTAFDGRRWTAPTDEVDDVDNLHNIDTHRAKESISTANNASDHNLLDSSIKSTFKNAIIQDIVQEPHNQRWIFALDTPLALTQLASDGGNITSYLTPYAEMRSNLILEHRIHTTVVSDLHANAIADKKPDAMQVLNLQRAEALTLPIGLNPLTQKWAQQIAQKSASPNEFINTVLSYFRNQPFRYTLSPPPLGRDQVDDFLFATRAGFCEHYASAFVVILRAAGIPARVVTGYQGGEINPVDNLLTVRQSDAHAWAEVYLGKRGWVRFDPTAAVAPERVEHGIRSQFGAQSLAGLINLPKNNWLTKTAQKCANQWDAINSAWNLWALNYNLEKQKNLMHAITGINNPASSQIGIAMMICAGIVAAFVALFLFYKRTVVSPEDKIYARFCRAMQKKGYPKDPHEGALAYCQRLQNTLAENHKLTNGQELLAEFAMLYTQTKYGKTINPINLTRLKKSLLLCLKIKFHR